MFHYYRWLLGLLLTALTIAITAYVLVAQYDKLPAQVPVHFDGQMRPDGFTPRENVWRMFFLIPAFMVAMSGLTRLLPWLSPKSLRDEKTGQIWETIMLIVLAMFSYLQLVLLWAALTAPMNTPLLYKLFLGGLSTFFAALGFLLGGVSRNPWMGVRTPWTLASDVVWNRTHQLAARMFAGAGLLSLLAVLASPSAWHGGVTVLVIALLLLAGLGPAVYSLVIYKRLERSGGLGNSA